MKFVGQQKRLGGDTGLFGDDNHINRTGVFVTLLNIAEQGHDRFKDKGKPEGKHLTPDNTTGAGFITTATA